MKKAAFDSAGTSPFRFLCYLLFKSILCFLCFLLFIFPQMRLRETMRGHADGDDAAGLDDVEALFLGGCH